MAKLGTQCCAFGCKKRKKKKNEEVDRSDSEGSNDEERFPVDKEEKRKWLINMRLENWQPSQYSKICSDHFKESDIDRTGCRVTLKRSAVPTRFKQFPSHLKKAIKKRKLPSARSVAATSTDEGPVAKKPCLQPLDNASGKSISELQKKIENLKKKLKVNLQKTRRLKQKVTSLKDLAKNLKEQNLISRSCEDILSVKFSGVSLELLKRMMHMNLSEKNFNLALPHQSHIRKWYSKIPAEPGFTEPAFTALSQKVEEGARNGRKVVCSLMLDEMAIRKHISWDGERYRGYVDIGDGNDDDSLPVAKDVLVFMVVAVNSSWKVPCAYFFIDGLTGSERANLVMLCIEKLHEVGVSVISLTCDGPSCHFTMMKELGANVDPEHLQTFPNPVDSNQKQFQGSEATVKFICIIDRLFDVLNSRNPCAKGFKSALCSGNKSFWDPFLDEAFDYISKLKDATGKLMYKTRRKTGFIGFLVAIKSIRGIFAEHVEPLHAPLKYLLTYKLSQDHIELFFGAVRSAGGFNNNPTVQQFTSAHKRLLLRSSIGGGKGNCQRQDPTAILHVLDDVCNVDDSTVTMTNIAVMRK
eukprot:gene12242-13503_t